MSDTHSSSGRLVLPCTTATDTGPRFAVNQATTPFWTLRQDVVGCQEVGVPALGLVRRKLEHPSATTGLTALFESSIDVSSLTWTEGFTGSDGRTFDAAVEDGIEAVKLAGLIGAGTLVVDTGGRNWHILTHARRLLDEGLAILADEADRHDLVIGLRPMHPTFGAERSFLGTVAGAIDVLDQHARESLGLVFDTRQLWFERDLVDRLPEWASRTCLLQVSDWRREPRPGANCVQPGKGQLPLTRLLAGLQENGFAGDCEATLVSRHLGSRNYIEVMMTARRRFEKLAGIAVEV